MSAILAQKGQASDSIQKLFIQMLKEYDQKAKWVTDLDEGLKFK